jgi:SAM-dependent methyltransferase
MNMWDQKFSEEGYYYGTEPNAFIKEWGLKIEKGDMLAIAEGEGRNAVYLAQLENNVTTWDYSKVAVEKTKALAECKDVKVHAQQRDLGEVEWPENSWDAIINVFGHLPKPLKVRTFNGIKKSLKPGGLFLTEVYSTKQLAYGTGGPRDVEFLFEPNELLEAFKDWRIIHFFYGEVERYEGKHHHGLSHVIQAVVEKP